MRLTASYFILLWTIAWTGIPVAAQSGEPAHQHLVQPGDSWPALAWRYQLNEGDLRAANPHINLQRQPVIGSFLAIPNGRGSERNGVLLRSEAGGLLQIAAAYRLNPWTLAILNNIPGVYRPLHFRPLFLSLGRVPPVDLPPGFSTLELSQAQAQPGTALAFRAMLQNEVEVRAFLENIPVSIFRNGRRLVGLVGTGAFFPPGDHSLSFELPGAPLWSQPWRMHSGEWHFEQITLTGAAAAIDQESIEKERERLSAIWNEAQPPPAWTQPFRSPIRQYVELTSRYGARRSYSGGPYRTYHEGVDFSAPQGTPVYAPAAGKVVLAEELFVRGGAVIIDHGLGVYTGVYHMSQVLVQPDQLVVAGEELGSVGSTGFSTGNHLHWDLLVGGTWVDGLTWLELETACWISDGWGKPCTD